jgi:hypothetical protein
MKIRDLSAAEHLPGPEVRRASASTVELVSGAMRVGFRMAGSE